MDRLNLIRQVLVAQIGNEPVHAIPTASLPPIPPIPPLAGPPQDGWGKPFDYAQGTAGSNVCGAPPNTTTFILASWGVDQEEGANPNTGQNDDIVVSQNNDRVKFIIQSQGTPCPVKVPLSFSYLLSHFLVAQIEWILPLNYETIHNHNF